MGMKIVYGFCFRPVLSRTDCSGPLLLWIADDRHKDRVRLIPTAYDVSFDEWDSVEGCVLPVGSKKRKKTLRGYSNAMARDLDTLARIISEIEREGSCTISELSRRFKQKRGGMAEHRSYFPEIFSRWFARLRYVPENSLL